MNLVAGDCVMERGTGVICDELKEGLPPRIISKTKDLVAELLELFNADCPNRLGDGFAALFGNALQVEFFKSDSGRSS